MIQVDASKNPIIIKESDRAIYRLAEIRKKQGINNMVPTIEYDEEQDQKFTPNTFISQNYIPKLKEEGKKNITSKNHRNLVRVLSANLNKGIESKKDLDTKIGK